METALTSWKGHEMKTAANLPQILDPWRDIIHPAALILPRPSDDEYAELKTGIEQHGMLVPIIVFVAVNGEQWLLDGISRLQALLELNRPTLDNGIWRFEHKKVYERHGADPHAIVLDLNIRRRHLTTEQRHEVIAALREQRPELSDRAIARMAEVDHHTVAAVRRRTELMGNPPHKPETPTKSMPAPELRREISGRKARGRRPSAQPLRLVEPKPPPSRCPHCGAPVDSHGRFNR